MNARVLIADDNDQVRKGLALVCRAAGHEVTEASSGRETLEKAREVRPDLVLLDLDMPEGTGMEVLPELLGLEGSPSVVILTGYVEVDVAVRAMRLGATNLLEKPIEQSELQEVLEATLAQRAGGIGRPRQEALETRSGPVVGDSPAIRRVLHHVERVAATPRTTILVTGESGVGKELVARAVHEHSARSAGPFVAVNCAALSEGLLEAELFGYEAGAFTGGNARGAEGLVRAAEGGTLFLDEIGELALPLQSKLLRVLQERAYRKVGGTEDLPMDARIVAATNRDLVEMVEEGSFREDLFYRVNVLSIHVPPLRERKSDIALMARHFLAEIAAELGRPALEYSEAAIERLENAPWPGNVRELRNGVERAAILAESRILPEHLVATTEGRPEPALGVLPDVEPGDMKLKSLEEAHIRRVIAQCTGNRSKAARELGINRTTLYNKMRQYGIEA
jgi:two-component system, NtrC family, response regulator AtoC